MQKLSLFIFFLYIYGKGYCGEHDYFFPSAKKDSNFVIKHRCGFKTYPPHVDPVTHYFVLRNQQGPGARRFFRATGWVFAVEACEMALLFNTTEGYSKWNTSQLNDIKGHYTNAFTMPPVIDKDPWVTNYLGHPYQGAFDYNALRSQGAPVWQSALFALLQSTTWEYLIEGSEERPSIQDLITTPVLGSLFGELMHYSTMQMAKDGFKWYEELFVLIGNPTYFLNNGFKFARHAKKPADL